MGKILRKRCEICGKYLRSDFKYCVALYDSDYSIDNREFFSHIRCITKWKYKYKNKWAREYYSHWHREKEGWLTKR